MHLAKMILMLLIDVLSAKFKFAGQNLGFLGSSDCNGLWGNMKASYKSIHDNWFNEKKDASMSDINKFTSLEGADGYVFHRYFIFFLFKLIESY